MAIDFSGRTSAKFSKKDLSHLLFATFSFAIIFFLYKWKTTDFSYNTAFAFFLFVFVTLFLSTIIAVYIQKKYAISKGYLIEYENSFAYVIAGILISFLFHAYLLVIVPGMIYLVTHQRLRLGHFRPLVHVKDMAVVSMILPIVYFVLFVISMSFYYSTGNFVFKEVMRIMIVMCVFYLVPAPKQNGLSIYRWSVTGFVIMVVTALVFFVAVFITEPAIILGTILGAAALFAIGVAEILPRIFYGA